MSTLKSKDILAKLMELVTNTNTGFTIPPQDELCKTYGVSRTMVREAIVILEYLGMIEVRPKTGTRVTSPKVWLKLQSEAGTQPQLNLRGRDFSPLADDLVVENGRVS